VVYKWAVIGGFCDGPIELERAEAKGGAELPMTDKKLSRQEQTRLNRIYTI
jgi:hypothetical protein